MNRLRCAVHESDDPHLAERGTWVMRFTDDRQARRVAAATGQALTPQPKEVELPDLLTELEVACHFGFIDADEHGALTSWIVP